MVITLSKAELVLPPFLDEDEDDIHERMLEAIPSEFDDREGSLIYDMTRPTALEIAKLIGFDFPLIIQSTFPQFAEGIFLDYHGERESTRRREAVYAKGFITVTAEYGTIIPSGTTVTTDEVDGVAIEYRTTRDITFDVYEGSIDIPIEAIEAGAQGNVPQHTINNVLEPIAGVSAITNNEAITGGYDEEDDDEYRERIIQTSRTRSYTGNKSDYIKWAKEIPGVGEVLVVPEHDGPGTVQVLIASSTGTVADPDLISRVQNHIAPDERGGGGLAPIGALVTVSSINSRIINVTFKATLEDDFDLETIYQAIRMQLSVYFSEELEQGGLIRHTKIGAIVMTTPGIIDYEDLRINGGSANIQLNPDEVAVVGTISEGVPE